MTTRMALICAGAMALGLAPSAYAQAIATDRVSAGMEIAGSPDHRGVPIAEERLTVAIDGQEAHTTLLQVYTGPQGGQIEGRYELRPGSGAHVDGFAYWNGEDKIVGEVFERQTARRVYQNVTTRKRDPGLLEEDGEGAFAFKIFPINAGEKKRVEVRWSKWLERRDHTVRYRAPITRRDAEIVVDIAANVKNLRSPTHRFHVDKTGAGVRVRSDGGQGTGELVLEWEVDDADWSPTAYVQAGGAQTEEGWFALSLAAPATADKIATAKDVTIVVDRSGSMAADDKIDHAKAAAADMIRRLSNTDRLNVVAFSDEVDPLFTLPKAATEETKRRALDFVAGLHDGGGTDLALALRTAIDLQAQKADGPRVIVFLTDGESDAANALDAAKVDTKDVRLFTLGLGKDVNKPLLQRLAATKRGTFGYIDTASAIETEVGRLASHISKPLLVDVSVDVEGSVASRIYPRTLPDLYSADELLVTGRLRGTGTVKLTIRGKLDGKPVVFTRTVDMRKAPARPWVGELWAQSRVAHLLEEISLGSSAPEMIDEVTNLALLYNFVTPYTAFLAIPDSELGGMQGTVEAMRDKKRKLLADNPDVAENTKSKRAFGADRPGLGTAAAVNNGAGKDDEDDDDAPMKKSRKTVADADDIEDGEADPDVRAPASPRYMEGSETISTSKHGCAGCATGGGADSLALGILVAGLIARRRRATPLR